MLRLAHGFLAGSPAHWLAACLVVAVAGTAVAVPSWRRAPAPQPVRPATAVGDATCLSCHRDRAAYEGTAHRLTMRPPTAGAIHGSFREGANLLHSADPGVSYRMHAEAGGFYETAIYGRAPDTTTRTERVAYVVGSGRKGQSFLYRTGDRIYQLPASYWTSRDRWIGSPGLTQVNSSAGFDRAIAPRCLECHGTWIESVPDLSAANRYHADSAILGVTCERCHGAGQEHVARERSAFHSLREAAIVSPARLTRERQIELCAQCHAGPGHPVAPTFTYVAGRPLDAYLKLTTPRSDQAVDVHSNQVAALARSRCFQASRMTCLTCHDPHRTNRDVADLSGRCLTCHQERSCGLYPQQGHALAGRCVDCHMPLQTSNLVMSQLDGAKQRVQGRTHWIRAYRDSAGR